MNTDMKKLMLAVIACTLSFCIDAAERVTVRISDGIENAAIKTKMEQTISAILTEANAAHEAKRELNYSALGIPSSVQGALSALWDIPKSKICIFWMRRPLTKVTMISKRRKRFLRK